MISANLVKELREKTGAGMMDCKKALSESAGDFEKAVDWLKAKGLAAAAKKAGRAAAEGLTALKIANNVGVAIELNAETDFVARNEQFQKLIKDICAIATSATNLEDLKKIKIDGTKTVEELIAENVATIGENLNLRRFSRVEVPQGFVTEYTHNAISSGLGKISVLVGLETTSNAEEIKNLGRQIAMHIAAMRPQFLDIESVDGATVERERNIFIEQTKNTGKPINIIEKMVEGRIRKFYQEIVLLEQPFVIDGKTRIADVLDDLSKKIGSPIKISSYARLELGEGVEKEQTDFASEVASVAGS
ncbi:MAG: translation elongation factor Ts [Rickettsiaceae bacterium]|nr:translation elongation factor Ts [Rickettsiaceae bacterium]